MALSSARVQVIEEPIPFGGVPLAPSDATGRSEAELARAMARRLRSAAPASDAAPLTVQLAALAALIRRGSATR
jgi:hypothetical protein